MTEERRQIVTTGLWLLACAVVVLGLDAALANDWPVDVDAVHLGLAGAGRFDPTHYQPHPPGYFGYVVYLKVLHTLGLGGGDPLALARWGARLAGAAAPVVAGLLVAGLGGTAGAQRAAGALTATNPLLLAYAMDGQGHPAEAVGVGLGLLACWRVTRSGSAIGCLLLGVLAGGLGGVRPTTTLLLAGPALWVCWRSEARLRSALLVGAGTLAGVALWLAPTVAASGGWAEWRALTATLVGETTAAALSPLSSTASAQSRLTSVATAGIGAVAAALPALAAVARRGALPRGLLVAFLLPAHLLFLGLFCAEPGYLLGGLLAWVAIGALAGTPRVAGLVALGQIALFLSLPPRATPVAGASVSLPSAASIVDRQWAIAAWTAVVTKGEPQARQLVVSDHPSQRFLRTLPLRSGADGLDVHFAGQYVVFRHDLLLHYRRGPLGFAPGPHPLADGDATTYALGDRYDVVRVGPLASGTLGALIAAQASCDGTKGEGGTTYPVACFGGGLQLGDRLRVTWETP